MSLWWWYIAALMFIGTVLSVGTDIARAIATGEAPKADDSSVGIVIAPGPPIRAHCPRCGTTSLIAVPQPRDKTGS